MSLKINHEYRVDFAKPRIESCIEVMQGDDMTRCIEIQLYCDGNTWTIPKGATPYVHWSRADGESGSYALSGETGAEMEPIIGESCIYVKLPADITAVPGVSRVAVALKQDETVLNTWSAEIKVHKNPHYQA
jgi:hypothetical protein